MSWLKDKILGGDKGLGDTVERFTKATGIKNLVDKVTEFTGKDCGCKKRKNLLNKIFSYDSLSDHNKNQLDLLLVAEKNEYWKEIKVENQQYVKITNENIDLEIEKLQKTIANFQQQMGH